MNSPAPSHPADTPALICAYLLQEDGSAQPVSWEEIEQWREPDGRLWIHLDRNHPQSRDWLYKKSGLSHLHCEALLAEETRPRMSFDGHALLLILRGVNLNPGANPEDMVSLRMWADAHRVISLRGQRILAIQDIRDAIEHNNAPTSSAELIVQLARHMTERVGPIIDELEDRLDGLEESLLGQTPPSTRRDLGVLRRESVALRRYLAPQREVLSRLAQDSIPWIEETQRARTREIADRTLRYVEDLDSVRERAAVTQEELLARQQDRMNRNMYVLSLVAAVFLPLGFITGLLGINVGGMPGTESSSAFYIVCAALLAIGCIEILWLYLRRWL